MPTEDEEYETEALILDEKGLQAEGPYSTVEPFVVYPIMEIVQLGLGYLFAWIIYNFANWVGPKPDFDLYNQKFALLKSLDLAWFYLAVFLFTKIPTVLQWFVSHTRKEAHVDNPDQYVFETKLVNQPYIRLVMDGAVGRFNRAQRGIDNFREILPGVLANALLAGYIFPKATFGAVCGVFLGRVLYSALYIEASDKRLPGGLIFMIANVVISGLVFFSIIKIFTL